MHVRAAAVADAEAIRTIYNLAVATSTATFDLVPRSEADQAAWMEAHQGAYTAVVAEDGDGRVAGYASISPYRDRAAYRTTVEDSVYVDASARRAGVGRALLEELLTRATAHGFHSVIARVGETNEPSIGLHRGCGFDVVGVEREVGRKFGRWLDVTVLQRML
ncbi:MAG: GNAT family N-acetyltransferase [Actinomycetota bacterium]|jgi:phosphinothricin acetyltransferase|nr:GNAT family N-acetyltransferase [Actinomycetota bacterium]